MAADDTRFLIGLVLLVVSVIGITTRSIQRDVKDIKKYLQELITKDNSALKSDHKQKQSE